MASAITQSDIKRKYHRFVRGDNAFYFFKQIFADRSWLEKPENRTLWRTQLLLIRVKALPIVLMPALWLVFSQVPAKTPKVLTGTGLILQRRIHCGICLQVCPVSGAIIPESRPDLQKTPHSGED